MVTLHCDMVKEVDMLNSMSIGKKGPITPITVQTLLDRSGPLKTAAGYSAAAEVAAAAAGCISSTTRPSRLSGAVLLTRQVDP